MREKGGTERERMMERVTLSARERARDRERGQVSTIL